MRRPNGALTPASCTVPSLHAKACTDSTNGSILYGTYSIQKLKSPENGRSIQSTTFWIGVTNKDDMRMVNSKARRLWTETQARPRQKGSEDSINERNPGKSINRSTSPCDYERQGATRAHVYTSAHKLHCALLQERGQYIFQQQTIPLNQNSKQKVTNQKK
jgi:hypothetical protein